MNVHYPQSCVSVPEPYPVFIFNSKIHWKNEIRIYKTVVFQILCYGFETWTMSRRAEEILDTIERRF